MHWYIIGLLQEIYGETIVISSKFITLVELSLFESPIIALSRVKSPEIVLNRLKLQCFFLPKVALNRPKSPSVTATSGPRVLLSGTIDNQQVLSFSLS